MSRTTQRVAGFVIGTMLITNLSGCFALNYDLSTLPEDQVSMTILPQSRVVERFSSEHKAIWVVGGLLPVIQPDLLGDIRTRAAGRRIQKLTIHSEQTILDGAITGGLVQLVVLAGLFIMFVPRHQQAMDQTSVLFLLGPLLIPHLRTIRIQGEIVEPEKTSD